MPIALVYMTFHLQSIFLAVNTIMHWIIKSKIELDDILPIVDNLTNTLDAIDLTKEPKSTQGAKSKQWQLLSVKDKDWIDLVEALKIKVKVEWKKKFNHDIMLACRGAWTVQGDEHSYHTLHSHQKVGNDVSNRISTVAYLHMPKRRWDGDGAFYFVKEDKSYHIDPEPGTFIIMPSKLLHGAYPQPAGLRQTLNLDFEWKDNDTK